MTGLYDDVLIEALRQGVKSVVGQWGLSEATNVRLLTVSENAAFRAEDPHRAEPVIFRVHRPGYHTQQEIVSELTWIKALRDAKVVNTPAPLTTKTGAHIASFDLNGDRRDVVAFDFVNGKEPSADEDLVPGFRKLGAINARLHAHARAWSVPTGFQRKTWDFDAMLGPTRLWGDWRAALGLTADGKAVLERCSRTLENRLCAYGKDAARFGLVHADLRLANLLVDDAGQIHAIDFDDCGLSWFMYDFAAAVSFYEHKRFIPDLRAAWLEGYRSQSKLSSEDEAMLPTFVMLRRMLLTAWLASHPETPTAQDLGNGYTEGTVALAEAFLSDLAAPG